MSGLSAIQIKMRALSQARRKRGGGGWGQVWLKPPNNFENNGATSQALIRCIVLYCFENNCPPNQQLLPTALRYPPNRQIDALVPPLKS